MNIKNMLIINGIIFLMMSPITSFIIVPYMTRLPSDFHQNLIFEGELGIFNENILQMEYSDVEIIRNVQTLDSKDDVMILQEDISIFDSRNDIEFDELSTTKVVGINPYSSNNLDGYGDFNRIGNFIFPVGVQKKDYLLWNHDLDLPYQQGLISADEAAFHVYFRKEAIVNDVLTYKYQGWQHDVFHGNLSGMPDVPVFYNMNQTFWAEKTTGAIVNLEKHWIKYAVFPDLHIIPNDLDLDIKMEGTLWILLKGRKQIDMVREITVVNEYSDKGYTILKIKDTTQTFDQKSDELIDVACKDEYHDIIAKTGEEIKNYDNVERQGHFLFPPNTKKTDYPLWNNEINAVSSASFIGTEEYEGLETYLFEIDEDKLLYDSTKGVERNVRYITKTKYWVEPTTGFIIDMEKQSKKKINPSHMILGLRGLFWFDIYRLSLTFTQETIDEHIHDAFTFKNKIDKLSEKNIVIADLEYHMNDQSIIESSNEAGSTHLLIFMMKIIVPIIFFIMGLLFVGLYFWKYRSWSPF